MKKLIIGISGHSCSGKTTLINDLKKNNYNTFITREHFPKDFDYSLIKKRSDVVKYFGKGKSVFFTLLPSLKEYMNSDSIIIESFKLPADKEVINELMEDVVIKTVYLYSSFDKRLERFQERARESDTSKIALALRDTDDHNYLIDEIAIKADLCINTENLSKEELLNKFLDFYDDVYTDFLAS